MVARGEALAKGQAQPLGTNTKKNVALPGLRLLGIAFQGLRSLCSLTPGYHRSPFRG
jgi:hypothetical protein